jgi:hypothetical protein
MLLFVLVTSIIHPSVAMQYLMSATHPSSMWAPYCFHCSLDHLEVFFGAWSSDHAVHLSNAFSVGRAPSALHTTSHIYWFLYHPEAFALKLSNQPASLATSIHTANLELLQPSLQNRFRRSTRTSNLTLLLIFRMSSDLTIPSPEATHETLVLTETGSTHDG